MKPPCKKEVNNVLVDCEKRCSGCRDTCEEWAEYQAVLIAEREKRRVNCMLTDMEKERAAAIRSRDNQMSRMMKKRRKG